MRINNSAWRRRFLAPTIITFALLVVLPLCFAIYLSLSNTSQSNALGNKIVGFDRYLQLLHSGVFWQSVRIEGEFIGGALVFELIFGFLIALLLNANLWFSKIARGLLLAPVVLPVITVALLFSYMLQASVGLISYYLEKIGIQQTFLDHGLSALAILVAIDIWQFTPFVALLLLAGLQSVPKELVEAASLDGAGYLRRMQHVILPSLLPVLGAVTVLRFLDAVQVFPTIYVLTAGGPGTSTSALNFYTYQIFFVDGNFSKGAAASVLMTVAVLLIGGALMYFLTRKGKMAGGVI